MVKWCRVGVDNFYDRQAHASLVSSPSIQPLSLTSFDSSPSRGASGEETKLYAMPRPPLLGEVASSVSDDDGEVVQSRALQKMRQKS